LYSDEVMSAVVEDRLASGGQADILVVPDLEAANIDEEVVVSRGSRYVMHRSGYACADHPDQGAPAL